MSFCLQTKSDKVTAETERYNSPHCIVQCCQGCICQIFTGGVRVSTGYEWPSGNSGHGGCQIGKRRIVVY